MDALLRWLSMIVPGMSAGLAWKVTEGLPLLNRFASGIAVGVAIYVVIYFAVKGFRRRDRS